MLESLILGGVWIYETCGVDNGRFAKPSNPAFLRAPGELLLTVRADPFLRVRSYEDGYVVDPEPARVQRICARKVLANTMPESLRAYV